MNRWSVAIEVDVSFPAATEDDAVERAEEIAAAMADRLLGRRPPGWARRSARVVAVEANGESGAVLPAP